jgi:type II secretory pathway pseudopilin PulG
LLVVIAIIGILVALLLPAVQNARESARRTGCKNNLKQLGLALATYVDAFGTFPPGSVRRFAGTFTPPAPLGGSWQTSQLSWMTRLLPYLDQKTIYKKIDWSQEQGDQGATHAILRNTRLGIFRCPSDGAKEGSSTSHGPTNYVACIGHTTDRTEGFIPPPGGVPTAATHNAEGVMLVDSYTSMAFIRDGASNTMIVSECKVNEPWVFRYQGDVAGYTACQTGTAPPITANNASGGRGYSWFFAQSNQAWTYSTRLPPNDQATKNHECEDFTTTGIFGARSHHVGGVHVLTCDGAVRFVNDNVDRGVWKAVGTRNGREVISQF